MQEEIESRTVTLAITTTKLSGRVLKAAIGMYLAHLKAKKLTKATTKPTGKQTVKELVGQNVGVSNIEVTDKNIKGFDKVARKYGVDYAIRKDPSCVPPKYLVFFKARDADALTAAFNEYMNNKARNQNKPSIIKLLRSLKIPEIIKDVIKMRKKEKGIEM